MVGGSVPYSRDRARDPSERSSVTRLMNAIIVGLAGSEATVSEGETAPEELVAHVITPIRPTTRPLGEVNCRLCPKPCSKRAIRHERVLYHAITQRKALEMPKRLHILDDRRIPSNPAKALRVLQGASSSALEAPSHQGTPG